MIWIILLGGMVQGAFAQNLEIKGMVRDARNKEILEFANVVLKCLFLIVYYTSCEIFSLFLQIRFFGIESRICGLRLQLNQILPGRCNVNIFS